MKAWKNLFLETICCLITTAVLISLVACSETDYDLVAVDDGSFAAGIAVDPGSSVSIDVLANDGIFPTGSGKILFISSINQEPSMGTATINDGKIVYQANSSAGGQDSFQYTVIGAGQSDSATVYLEIHSDVVRATSDGTFSLLAKNSSTFDALNVLNNDLPGPSAVTIISEDSPRAAVSPDGKQIYYFATQVGADSFNYTIQGPGGVTSTASVSLQVAPSGLCEIFNGSLSHAAFQFGSFGPIDLPPFSTVFEFVPASQGGSVTIIATTEDPNVGDASKDSSISGGERIELREDPLRIEVIVP